MRKWILALFLFHSVTVFAANAVVEKKAELSRVTDQIHSLQKIILVNKQQQQNLDSQLKNTEILISLLSQQINTLNLSINQEETQLSQLTNARQPLQAKLSQEQNALAQRMRAAYRLQHLQSLKIILNQDDPTIIERHLNYYRYLSYSKMQLIDTINLTLNKLTANMQAIAQHQDMLKQLLVQKQTQQTELHAAQLHRPALVEELKKNLLSKQQQLTLLQSNQKDLQTIISHLQTESKNSPDDLFFEQLHGKLHWPVKGKIIAHFGSLLDVGNQHLSGVLIAAPQETPVHAIYAGKVIFANWLRGFGLLIIINHNNEYMSLYGRNHTLYAKVGDQVNTGDVIAAAGNSGGFNKPSLYFEIRQNGSAVNPNLWCR